jgi:hypothetical protein
MNVMGFAPLYLSNVLAQPVQTCRMGEAERNPSPWAHLEGKLVLDR